MRKRAKPFGVTRSGAPIDQHAIKNAVNPGINYSMAFLEYEACIAAGLDISEWESPMSSYSNELKASVIAWHGLSNEIAVHGQDAKNRKEERMQRRRK